MGMIRGLDTFRGRFRTYEGSLVLIGGAACDDWFTRQGLTFRATKDLDIVLLLEAVDHNFVATMRQFINDGGYEIRQRSESGPSVLYRFVKPTNTDFPHMLELFSRAPEGMDLGDDQTIVPIPLDEAAHSLSAILVKDIGGKLAADILAWMVEVGGLRMADEKMAEATDKVADMMVSAIRDAPKKQTSKKTAKKKSPRLGRDNSAR